MSADTQESPHIGYRRPPKHTRFKPGSIRQSEGGDQKGRDQTLSQAELGSRS